MCHRYASCVGGSCECNDGYTGDGKNCIGLEIIFIKLNTSPSFWTFASAGDEVGKLEARRSRKIRICLCVDNFCPSSLCTSC